MESKQEVRKRIRVLKRELTLEQKMQRSEPIMHKVEALPAFEMAHTVLLYWSMDDEVQTHAFVNKWYKGKTLLLPCVQGNDLVLRQYSGPECNRMGRGRGFYDRLLKSTPHAVKVGVAFSFQILDSIPTEPFDVKMDHVISE